jgi:hypothetical protein
MRDAPAGHSAMHLDALEVQPFDFGHELPLLGDCDKFRLIEKPGGDRRNEQRELLPSRHEIY